MGVDWGFIGSLSQTQIDETEDDLPGDVCKVLLSDIGDEDVKDPANVKHLLKVAGWVIQSQSKELQEVERYATELVNEAEGKIVKLESALKVKEAAISDLQIGGTGRDARYLRDELRTLEAENQRLQREMKDLSTETAANRDTVDKITNELMDHKANARRLEGDNDQLRKDILDLKNQMEAQREALLLKREGDEGRMMKRLQSEEQTRYLGEIHELREANEELKDQIESVCGKLETANRELTKRAEEYESVRTVVEETDKANTRLVEEGAALRLRLEEAQERLEAQGAADNTVMAHVNTEVERWRGLLRETEERLRDADARNRVLEQKLDATRLDADKKVLAELTQAVADKDKQIDELKEELDEGYKQMQLMGEFAEELQASEAVRETNQLEKLLTDYKTAAKAERERLRRLEAESGERDKELAEALLKIGQYEAGTYGLREAVQEIKDLKKQTGIRDREIGELTKQLNKLELNLGRVMDENEEMRRRLGLAQNEDIDLSELRFAKEAEQEQLRAINRLLNTEVERLEKERLELKKVLRKQAMHRGVRAVELGLKTEDLEAIERAAAEAGVAAGSVHEAQEQVIAQLREIKSEDTRSAEEVRRELGKLRSDHVTLNKRTEELSSENGRLTAELGQVRQERERFEGALKEALKKGAPGRLEDSPEVYRLLSLLENRLSTACPDLTQHLKSQVAQLTGRNMELRAEVARARDEVRRSERERAGAVADLARLNPARSEHVHTSLLPGSDRLAQQLVIALQEVEEKEGTLRGMEKTLGACQREIIQLTAKQGVIYEEHLKAAKEQPTPVQQPQENDGQVYREEYERLRATLERSPEDQKKSIADSSRKLVLLKVSERSLKRELRLVREGEERRGREVARLQAQLDFQSQSSKKKLLWLEEFREGATQKIAKLNEQLVYSVPQRDVERLYDIYTKVATKYRKLLEGECGALQKTNLAGIQEQLNAAQSDLADCQKKLLLKTQRCELLEGKLSGAEEGSSSQLQEKVHQLEVQLLNEQQKANHAIAKHSKLLSVTEELESRNTKLEGEMTEILDGRENQPSTDSPTKPSTDRTEMLEKQVSDLQKEVRRLRTVAEITEDQKTTLLTKRKQFDKEIEQLQFSVSEMAKQTDDHLTISILTSKLVELNKSDIQTQRTMEELKKKLSQEEGRVLALQRKLADRSQIEGLRQDKIVAHVQLMSRTICYLKGQFAGSTPLHRQDRLAEAVSGLLAEKQGLATKLEQALKERGELEVELEEVRGSARPVLSSAGRLRLSEMRLRREVGQLRQQASYLEALARDHEERVGELEEENGGLYELLTEQQALASAPVTALTNVQKEVKGGREREPVKLQRPDTSKIVSLEVDHLKDQLEKKGQAMRRLKEEVSLLKASLKTANGRVAKLERSREKLEEEVVVKGTGGNIDTSIYQKSQASAQQAIQVLNNRLDQKDSAIKQFQEVLKKMREDAKAANEKHQNELSLQSKQHALKEQDWLRKYEELSRELHSIQALPVVPHNRAELEELVLEQDKNNAQLRDGVFKLRQELSDLKQERKEEQAAAAKEREKAASESTKKVEGLKGEISELTKQNSDLLVRNKSLSDGLKRGGEGKAVAEKDEEIGKLKAAIIALKGEMKSLEEKKSSPVKTAVPRKPKKTEQKPIVAPPVEPPPPPPQQQRPNTTETWLENKKWAKKVDQLKKSVSRKDSEIDTLSKQNSSLKDTIERLDREKTSLSLKLRKAKPAAPPETAAVAPTSAGESRDRVYEVERENASLRLILAQQGTLPLDERDKTIAVLRVTVADLEQQIQTMAGEGIEGREFAGLREAARVQEKKLIEAEHRALSLNLQLEHLKLEVPRLRTRVSDLQEHNEVLKKARPGTAPVAARPAKGAGKSVGELERVVSGMRRVVDKLQRENDEQKRELEKLRAAKSAKVDTGEKLRGEVREELRGEVESEVRREVSEKVTALRAELDLKTEEAAQLKKELTALQQQEETVSSARGEQIDALTSQNAQLGDENLALKSDLSRKNGLLSEIRRRLTGLSERESDLEEEIRLLHECKMPSGAKEIAREAVRLKRRNALLEERLEGLTAATAPNLDPLVLEKLTELKEEKEAMVKKIVGYQKHLETLSAKHPDIDFSDPIVS